MITEEEVYDPLSQAQKHIMLRNGFEFDNVKQGTCCCGHSVNDHLGAVDCCLVKTKEICICEKYLEEGSKVTMPQKQGKLPYKEDDLLQKQQKDNRSDRQLDSYIQQLARM